MPAALHHPDEPVGQFVNPVCFARDDCRVGNQFFPYTERGGARFNELCRSLLIHSAGSDERHVRKWRMQSFHVRRTTHLRTRIDLDHVGAGMQRTP